jgi:hypothetical protein
MKHEATNALHIGRPCGNCNGTSYRLVPGGSNLGQYKIDGWCCVVCGLTFIDVGAERDESSRESGLCEAVLPSTPETTPRSKIMDLPGGVSETDPPSLEGLPHDTPDDLKIKDGNFTITKKRIHPLALRWLRVHKKDLKAAGWTSCELYRRAPKWNKGIAWLCTWGKENCIVEVNSNGEIEFSFGRATGDKPTKQTTRRRPDRKNSSTYATKPDGPVRLV